LFSKILIAPLRLAIGWNAYPRVLGVTGILMLVLLRVCVGWHFYVEGVDKSTRTGWDPTPFFANARGPFADYFQEVVWDWDGAVRQDVERNKQVLARFRDVAGNHFRFNENQQQRAQQAYADAIAQIEWELQENAEELEEYRLGRERIKDLARDPMRDGVASLGGQRATIRKEWKALAAPVFVQIDKAWTLYEKAINDIATEDQRRAAGTLSLVKPRTQAVDTSILGDIIPYFDLAIGICLLFGFLTPVAALAAAGFLGSVFLSQYPPAPGPGSTYYQLIEAMACLVLAGTGAGRFAGLDFVFHAIVRRVWPSQENS
jgi:uncharacterized membrane protein YphA (DoxX/SURF4 family)